MVASLGTAATEKAHTSDTSLQSNTTIAGLTLASAMASWWNAPGAPASVVRAADVCEPVPCNPTCPPGNGAHVMATLADELDAAGVMLERNAWM